MLAYDWPESLLLAVRPSSLMYDTSISDYRYGVMTGFDGVRSRCGAYTPE
jgi:hypothetical protein